MAGADKKWQGKWRGMYTGQQAGQARSQGLGLGGRGWGEGGVLVFFFRAVEIVEGFETEEKHTWNSFLESLFRPEGYVAPLMEVGM